MSPQRLATLQQIPRLRAVRRRAVKRRVRDLLVADGNVEARAEFAKFLLVELFLLMRNIPAFAGLAQAVAFDCFGQDDRGLPGVFGGGLVGGVDLASVVAAAKKLADLLVAEVID